MYAGTTFGELFSRSDFATAMLTLVLSVWFTLPSLARAPVNPVDSVFKLSKGEYSMNATITDAAVAVLCFVLAMQTLELLTPLVKITEEALPRAPALPHGVMPAAANEALVTILNITFACALKLFASGTTLEKRAGGTLIALVVNLLRVVEGGAFSGSVGNPAAAISLATSTFARANAVTLLGGVARFSVLHKSVMTAVTPTVIGCTMGAISSGLLVQFGKVTSAPSHGGTASTSEQKHEKAE